MPTLTTLRLQTRRRIGESIVDSEKGQFNNDVINQFINEGQQKILQYRSWSWHRNYDTSTITTVDGTQEYSLPTDFLRVIDQQVFYDGGDPDNIVQLTKIDETDRFKFDTSDTGEPDRYWIRYDEDNIVYKIGLESTPDTAQEVYFQYETQLTDLDDTTNPTSKIPSEWHYIMSIFAAWKLLVMDEDFSKARVFEQEFKEALTDMAKAFRKNFIHSSLPGFRPLGASLPLNSKDKNWKRSFGKSKQTDFDNV